MDPSSKCSLCRLHSNEGRQPVVLEQRNYQVGLVAACVLFSPKLGGMSARNDLTWKPFVLSWAVQCHSRSTCSHPCVRRLDGSYENFPVWEYPYMAVFGSLLNFLPVNREFQWTSQPTVNQSMVTNDSQMTPRMSHVKCSPTISTNQEKVTHTSNKRSTEWHVCTMQKSCHMICL